MLCLIIKPLLQNLEVLARGTLGFITYETTEYPEEPAYPHSLTRLISIFRQTIYLLQFMI